MGSSKIDFSVLNKFNFQKQPVGVKFMFNKPAGINHLNKTLAFCEMFIEAQNSEPFYVTKENHECAGTIPLGMVDVEPLFASGMVGEKLGVFEDARTGKRPYYVLPRFEKNTVNYVVFSSLSHLTFDPDILIVTANLNQAEIILRASSYRTGQMWTSKTTAVLGCAWLYIYPYISGEMNYMVTGICSGGMTARRILPEGLVLISIPFDQIPGILDNLKNMQWVPPEYKVSRDRANEFFNNIVKEMSQNR
jgi:uncharacterized protein (DUF169 family)